MSFMFTKSVMNFHTIFLKDSEHDLLNIKTPLPCIMPSNVLIRRSTEAINILCVYV